MREELIIKYLDQSLSPEEAINFEQLAESDNSIWEEIQQVQQLDLLFNNVDFTVSPSPQLAAKLQKQLIPLIEIPLIDLNQKESIYVQLKDIALPIAVGIMGILGLLFSRLNNSLNTTSVRYSFINETTVSYLMLTTTCILGLFMIDKLLQKKFRGLSSFIMC